MTIAELLTQLRSHQVSLRLANDKLICELPKDGIPTDLRQELIARKDALKAYIADLMVDTASTMAIAQRSDTGQPAPLSSAQESLWLLDQLNSSANYNMPNAIKLSGDVNIDALNSAFTIIFERHESLRSCFQTDSLGSPVQTIKPAHQYQVPQVDLSKRPIDTLQPAIDLLLQQEAARPFDISCDHMMRALLIKLSDAEHILSVTMHHIASDGWSVTVLIKEFAAIYEACVLGMPNPLAALPVQYADYTSWQRTWLQGNDFEKKLHYWEQQLADLPIAHNVPLDFPRPNIQTAAGQTYITCIDSVTTASLTHLCNATGATLYMGLHAAFAAFLSRYSNQSDIVIGTVVANREQPEVVGLIGYFINALVLRSDLSGDPSFQQLLSQSKKMLLDAYANQQVPLGALIDRLLTQPTMSHSPLFQVMLILQNTEAVTLELPNLSLAPIALENKTSKHDLTLYVTEVDGELSIAWEYNTDLFKADTIARMASHFEVLLKKLVAQPANNIFSLNLLTEQETHQQLFTWNDTARQFPNTMTIHQLIEEQATLRSDAIALVFGTESLTYAKLNTKANQLAAYLTHNRPVGRDMLIGICLDRSLDMIVAILGVLKAGCAYVPLDPNYPEARLAYMLEDAELDTVITHSSLLDSLPITYGQAICVDDNDLQQALAKHSGDNVEIAVQNVTADHLAYVIYTSGSTGNPKGVMISHSSLVNLTLALIDRYQLTPQDSVLQFAPISFDMSVEEIFGALCAGATLVIRDDAWLDSVQAFYHYCNQQAVTLLNLPTAFWHELARDDADFSAKSVRHISIGGEKVNDVEINRWFEKTGKLPRVFNAYGPTECTVNASFAEITPDNHAGIGRALPNTSLYVLNAALQPAPVNVPGELCLGGVGLARGYLNKPELTREKFVANPYANSKLENNSEYLYKTGDLVRWTQDGNVEFLGRIDHQVKIRGYRIELGEIEQTLKTHALVSDAIVTAKATAGSDYRLVAYVQVESLSVGINPFVEHEAVQQLSQHIKQYLPDYMVPSAYAFLERFPLTPNGKIDRKALPDVDVNTTRKSYIAPVTEYERRICAIWEEVLGIKHISMADNFFQLGGHSLLAIRTLSRINAAFGVNLSIKSFFFDATVAGVANVIVSIKMADADLQYLPDENLVEEGFF